MSLDESRWEAIFTQALAESGGAAPADPAHDLAHFRRVVRSARSLCEQEGASWSIVFPAAWLHDLVNVPKDDPRRALASRLSAEAAVALLQRHAYPESRWTEIAHAIEAHSFSAGIPPRTLEARIVQDADRLDALGAIGIARCFAVAGMLRRSFYAPEDPFVRARAPDDARFTIDHFYAKLFKIAETMQTAAGKAEAQRRGAYMRGFLAELGGEI